MGIDELLDKNMEFASVIRSLRKNAREDAEQIARLERERDEAREKAERYRLEANSLMLQRDEAREAIAVADELASIAAVHLGWYLAHYPFTSTDLEQTRKITAAIQRWKKLKEGAK